MKIREFFAENCIKAELNATDKASVIEEMAALVSQTHADIDQATLHRILLEREQLGSTGIGNGVAILHGKLPTLETIVTGFGRSTTGIAFDAQDGEPVHLFFILAAPKNSASLHLKAMARLSRLLKDSHFRSRLFEAADADKIYNIIVSEDDKF